jgi:hypothetical protein
VFPVVIFKAVNRLPIVKKTLPPTMEIRQEKRGGLLVSRHD